MRHLRTLLACAVAFGAVTAAAPPAGATNAVLATKAEYAGSSPVTFQIRDGERYVHLLGSATVGTVALDVKTPAGYVRVCHSTKSGPLDIAGAPYLVVVPVLNDVTCGVPAATGTIMAIFSRASLSLAEAIQQYEPDTGRAVTGGL